MEDSETERSCVLCINIPRFYKSSTMKDSKLKTLSKIVTNLGSRPYSKLTRHGREDKTLQGSLMATSEDAADDTHLLKDAAYERGIDTALLEDTNRNWADFSVQDVVENEEIEGKGMEADFKFEPFEMPFEESSVAPLVWENFGVDTPAREAIVEIEVKPKIMEEYSGERDFQLKKMLVLADSLMFGLNGWHCDPKRAIKIYHAAACGLGLATKTTRNLASGEVSKASLPTFETAKTNIATEDAANEAKSDALQVQEQREANAPSPVKPGQDPNPGLGGVEFVPIKYIKQKLFKTFDPDASTPQPMTSICPSDPAFSPVSGSSVSEMSNGDMSNSVCFNYDASPSPSKTYEYTCPLDPALSPSDDRANPPYPLSKKDSTISGKTVCTSAESYVSEECSMSETSYSDTDGMSEKSYSDADGSVYSHGQSDSSSAWVDAIEWTITTPFVQKGQYVGPVSDGDLPHGVGRFLFSNGDEYDGPFHMGEMHGPGAMVTEADGSVYKGEFQQNLRHGCGEYTTESRRYVGQFEHGRKHGDGALYYLDGSIDFEGGWLFGQPMLNISENKEHLEELFGKIFGEAKGNLNGKLSIYADELPPAQTEGNANGSEPWQELFASLNQEVELLNEEKEEFVAQMMANQRSTELLTTG
jgi:hypothetical protein